MFKNVASQKWTVMAFNASTGARVTGDAANITGKIEQDDDGTRSATNDVNPAEAEDGIYKFDLTQAETDGDKLTIFPESSTANVIVIGCPTVVYTRPQYFPDLNIASDGDFAGNVDGAVATLAGHTPQTGDSFARLAAPAGASVSADIAAIKAATAAIVAVIGALNDAAAAGDPTASDTLMQYVKQIVNVLVGTAGVATFPAESAPGNAVSLAEVLRAIHVDVTGLNGDAMRGTDSAALASVATEARLAELDVANLPTGVAAILVDTSITLQAELDGIQADTEDIQTQIGVAGAGLTDLGGMSTAMKAEVNAEVDGALDSAIPVSPTTDSVNEVLKNLAPSAKTIITGAAAAGTLSTTQMTTDLAEATDDHYNGRILIWTSGALLGQATDISDYTGSTKLLTFTAVTEAPNAGDAFVIL